MYGLRAGDARCCQQALHVEVAGGGHCRADMHRPIRHARVQGVAVGVGEDCDGREPLSPAGPDHAAGDVAAVRDQNGVEGSIQLSGTHSSTTSTSPSCTASAGCTRTSRTVPATGALTGISIFIDSRVIKSPSAVTASPGATCTRKTLPVLVAVTSIISSPLLLNGAL